MAEVTQSIDVEVPVRTAYNQWTQLDEFPRFMEGVKSVAQIDDTHLRWVASVGGKERAWDAEITEQRPDQRIAWRSTDRPGNSGVVTFDRLGEARTRIMVRIEAEAESVVDAAGDALGVLDRRVKGDLERFKEFIESRGHETGAWRGEVGAGASRS